MAAIPPPVPEIRPSGIGPMLPEISPLLPACDYPIENDTNGWERDGPLLDWRSKERSL